MKGRIWKQILAFILVTSIVFGDSAFVFVAETIQETTSVVDIEEVS